MYLLVFLFGYILGFISALLFARYLIKKEFKNKINSSLDRVTELFNSSKEE